MRAILLLSNGRVLLRRQITSYYLESFRKESTYTRRISYYVSYNCGLFSYYHSDIFGISFYTYPFEDHAVLSLYDSLFSNYIKATSPSQKVRSRLYTFFKLCICILSLSFAFVFCLTYICLGLIPAVEGV